MAFHPIDRDIDFLLPPSVQEWLPTSHLARYVVDVVEGLDLSELEQAYAGRGSAAYHPATLLGLLIYGYATGTFSSRKIERATYDSLAFRYIACNRHPDHDTLAAFRKRFGLEFSDVFVLSVSAAGGPGEPALRVWHRQFGRLEDSCQRQPAQETGHFRPNGQSGIKSVMGFRQFQMRGLDNVQTEWTLVCLAWNLKRMAVLRPQ